MELQTATPVRFLRRESTLSLTGKSKSLIYREIAAGLFPRAVPIGGKVMAWPAHEVDAVNRARLAGRSDADIRALVKSLAAQRASGGAA